MSPPDQTTGIDWKSYVDLRIAAVTTMIAETRAEGETRGLISATSVTHVEENLKLRFELNDRATTLASASIDKRLEGMNEFRQQLNDQAGHFVTRTEMEDKNEPLSKGIETNSAHLNLIDSKLSNLDGRIWAIGACFGVVVTLINIALHFVK